MNIFYHSAKKLEENGACLLESANLWQLNTEESLYWISIWLLSSFLVCCNRSCNNCINHLRALRIVYNDNVSSFEDLLQRDQTVSIDHRNIRLLAIEVCKIRNNISSHIKNELFKQRNIIYNLLSQTVLQQDQ